MSSGPTADSPNDDIIVASSKEDGGENETDR